MYNGTRCGTQTTKVRVRYKQKNIYSNTYTNPQTFLSIQGLIIQKLYYFFEKAARTHKSSIEFLYFILCTYVIGIYESSQHYTSPTPYTI